MIIILIIIIIILIILTRTQLQLTHSLSAGSLTSNYVTLDERSIIGRAVNVRRTVSCFTHVTEVCNTHR